MTTKNSTKSNPKPATAADATMDEVHAAPTAESIMQQVETAMDALSRIFVENEKRYMADNGTAYSAGWDLPVIDGTQVELTGEEVLVNQHQAACNWLVQSIPFSLEGSIERAEDKVRTAKYWVGRKLSDKEQGNATQADVDRAADMKADAEYRLELLYVAFDHARTVHDDLTGKTYLTKAEKDAAKRRAKSNATRPAKQDERMSRLRR